MILTADQFAQQIIAQARVLDPSISLEVGTPERKIVDAVAQALADNQIDLTGLASGLDIDSKFGSNLDQFTSLFGMQRQQPVAATGFVVFSRNTPATTAITIPTGTIIQANTAGKLAPMQYATTASGTVAIGQTSSQYIPVQAITTGTAGNAAANTLTIMVGTPSPGVTAVTNPVPLTNGFDAEDDNSFKVRFKNTWARNLAGTRDQFLALAVSSAYTTKANVVGLESRFQEYIQVPSYDDAGYLNGGFTPNQDTFGGVQGQWTTALSSIPYAKDIYTNVASYVSSSQGAPISFYYRSGVDFQFNYPPRIIGDVVREVSTTINGNQTGPGTINVTSTAEFPTTGYFEAMVNGSAWPFPTAVFSYDGITPTSFLNCAFAWSSTTSFTLFDGVVAYRYPTPSPVAPNFTFFNVYNPIDVNPISGLKAVIPGEVVLSEFTYLSQASRNDLKHNVNNAVDIYVDGAQTTQSTCVFLSDLQSNQWFTKNADSAYYYENYRRDGNSAKRPQLNNYITPLFQSPLTSLPNSITIAGETYYHNAHYWLVHEIADLGGSIRARDAIEWSNQVPGDIASVGAPHLQTDPSNSQVIVGPQETPYLYSGTPYNAIMPDTAVTVAHYDFDANIATLQAAMEGARQVTTDVLVHKAKTRYLKLDITVVYSSNANPTVVNATIAATLQAFFARQYFGAVIQLSTLLEVIHEVNGVDNVRWSNDLPIIPNLIRVMETDIYGNPLHGASIDRLILGTNSTQEVQTLYIVGNPIGVFTLTWADPTPGTILTDSISFTDPNGGPVHAATIQTAIHAAVTLEGASAPYTDITVTQDSRPTFDVDHPIRSYTITYSDGTPYIPQVTGILGAPAQAITTSDYTFDTDFFLLDDELPALPQYATTGDTLPGLIIRPRAQSTFYRPGLTS